jgi:hypothetical protein
MYYKQATIIDHPIGNNAFVYDERKQLFGKAEIVVPAIIEGSLDDVKVGKDIVFAEKMDGEVKEFVGLEKLVITVIARKERRDWRGNLGDTKIATLRSQWRIGRNDEVSVYVMDNHNHALYCWYKEYVAWNIEKWLPVIHIDQHSDMNDPVGWIDGEKENDLAYIAIYVNEVCTIADFIQPALRSGLVSECVQVRTENGIINGKWWMVNGGYILDIDIDFWAPEMSIGEFDRTIQKTRQLIAGASLVTIATSPCFIDQDRAVEIVNLLLS